ncbi:hypothetical protein [Saccharothrix variisporea]|uniref:Uncharacterized protein n=1 Tax=Saccharothrix variisporea TaxID=543527 RepID=A0A495X9S2_9PSEU|nr:hypothetical protein [Saccharothrix variisporea]RKT69363.1 hypothetical protein DFJ66_2582 [Saccharothrix variisporea]
MTENASFSRCLTDVTTAVQRGDITTAKRYAAHLLDQLDDTTHGIVAACVETIERFPQRADVHLRARWKAATSDTAKTVIAAFGTAFAQRDHNPKPTPEPPDRRKWETAPRDLRTEFRPEARRTLTEHDRARLRAQNRSDAQAAAYADRAGIDDQPPPAPVYASGLDYDRAAVHALRGTPCVRCWLERTPADYRTHSDDGLCGECRDKGRPGIPELPAGHTRADAVRARCDFLAATYGNSRALLAQWWKTYATPADRHVITDWAHHHPFTEPPATDQTPTPHTDATDADTGELCTRCDYPRADDAPDTLCDDCREVDQMITNA